MCKRHHRTEARSETRTETTAEGAYEGETRRLDPRGGEMAMRRVDRHYVHFPWWILFFAWPLIGLIKGAVVELVTVVGAVGGGGVPLILPLLLIALGIYLFRRR